jgi:MscS family membrane protein
MSARVLLTPRWLLTVVLLAQLAGAQVPLAPGASKAATTKTSPAATGSPTPAPTSSQEQASDDPLGRGTPRGTVLGFVKAVNRNDYDEAAKFLDTRQHGELASELAQQLKEVLDQDTSIDLARLSRKPQGSQADPLHPNREEIGIATTSTGQFQIFLDRVTHNSEPPIWLFSSQTLAQVPEAYENLNGPSQFEQKLPAWLRFRLLASSIWRWLILIVAIAAILLLGTWINRLLNPLFRKIAERSAFEGAVGEVRSVRAPLVLLLLAIFFLIFGATSPSLLGRAFWRNLGLVVLVLAITWLATRTVGLITELSLARLKRLQAADKIAFAGLIGRLLQIAALLIGLLVILRMRGVNLTALLAGLGIGGLAIAFAAQKTLENLFGGIMIISDRPIRIGDHCRIGLVEGSVLDIGLRSTRIRTLDRTIVTIPNGQLSVMNVENFTLRDKFWFRHILTLRYDTTAAEIEAVLAGIRKLFEEEAYVETSTARANFNAIASVSDNIDISAYIFAENGVVFFQLQEILLLRILAIVEASGAEFSLPTQLTKLIGPSAPENQNQIQNQIQSPPAKG